MQAASREAGPQVPTWMAEREQTFLAPLWWRQLSTLHWIQGLAFMFWSMRKAPFSVMDLVCAAWGRVMRGPPACTGKLGTEGGEGA